MKKIVVFFVIIIAVGLFFTGCDSNKNKGEKSPEIIGIEKILQGVRDRTLIRLKNGEIILVLINNNKSDGGIVYAKATHSPAGTLTYEELAPRVWNIVEPKGGNYTSIGINYSGLAVSYLTQDFRKKEK